MKDHAINSGHPAKLGRTSVPLMTRRMYVF